ncbi:Lrp/AsnC family transcriptional regulator [Sphingomonas sp. CROZ-RG-20F-R02-07]|uniref:Lrp/AsnC family transcriptional regulator n=1 Tax=Sphingomonas sp. CROZ-RG-20F-R02-07 TaxID=2914832 RepID=UPI001F59BF27|nr:Lrp/AsnC family transcriptional regulator [Sphingomonas sp. CROZ-RG-20F-R02-07]
MDNYDRAILRHIQSEPDLTTADLAARVGLSQTPCWRRLKTLETTGVILGRAVLLDPAKVGYPVSVIAHVRIAGHDEVTLEGFETQVCAHPEIVECFSMSGDSDYLMRIVARSIEDYERFLKKVLLHLPGVSAVNSSFALKQVKATTDLPV